MSNSAISVGIIVIIVIIVLVVLWILGIFPPGSDSNGNTPSCDGYKVININADTNGAGNINGVRVGEVWGKSISAANYASDAIFGPLSSVGIPFTTAQKLATSNGVWYYTTDGKTASTGVSLGVAYDYSPTIQPCNIPCVSNNCINCVNDGNCQGNFVGTINSQAVALKNKLISLGLM